MADVHYSAEEVEALFARRQAERKELIEEALKALEPTLAQIRKEISDANHLKREFGEKIQETLDLVKEHIAQPMHPGTAISLAAVTARLDRGDALAASFGIDALTPDARKSFPTMMDRWYDQNVDKPKRRETFWRRAAWVATTVAASIALLGALGFFAYVRHWLGVGNP